MIRGGGGFLGVITSTSHACLAWLLDLPQRAFNLAGVVSLWPEHWFSAGFSIVENDLQETRDLGNGTESGSSIQQRTAQGSDVSSLEGKEDWIAAVDLEALKSAVARFLPGEECTEAVPLNRGAYHGVALLHLRSGRKIVGRVELPSDSGKAQIFQPYKDSSEFATLRYVKAHTTIPVPEVFAHDEDVDHVIGGKYALQEYLPGEALSDIWDNLPDALRKSVFEQIAAIQLQLLHLSFDTIGSLQEADDSANGFSIGPLVIGRNFDLETLIGLPKETGPWISPREWLASVIRDGLEYQYDRAGVTPERQNKNWISAVMERVRRVDNGVPDEGDLTVCCLRHWDLDLHNILVEVSDDNSSIKITGVLDWEGAHTVPRWAVGGPLRMYNFAEHDISDALVHYHEVMLRDPLYARARQEGRTARALFFLCATFGICLETFEDDIAQYDSGGGEEDILCWW